MAWLLLLILVLWWRNTPRDGFVESRKVLNAYRIPRGSWLHEFRKARESRARVRALTRDLRAAAAIYDATHFRP